MYLHNFNSDEPPEWQAATLGWEPTKFSYSKYYIAMLKFMD